MARSIVTVVGELLRKSTAAPLANKSVQVMLTPSMDGNRARQSARYQAALQFGAYPALGFVVIDDGRGYPQQFTVDTVAKFLGKNVTAGAAASVTITIADGSAIGTPYTAERLKKALDKVQAIDTAAILLEAQSKVESVSMWAASVRKASVLYSAANQQKSVALIDWLRGAGPLPPAETDSPTPTPAPTAAPAATPTPAPTAAPTPAPTATPTPAPTAAPTPAPTAAPTPAPTAAPTPAPTPEPTPAPTPEPTPTPAPTPEPDPVAAGLRSDQPQGPADWRLYRDAVIKRAAPFEDTLGIVQQQFADFVGITFEQAVRSALGYADAPVRHALVDNATGKTWFVYGADRSYEFPVPAEQPHALLLCSAGLFILDEQSPITAAHIARVYPPAGAEGDATARYLAAHGQAIETAPEVTYPAHWGAVAADGSTWPMSGLQTDNSQGPERYGYEVTDEQAITEYYLRFGAMAAAQAIEYTVEAAY